MQLLIDAVLKVFRLLLGSALLLSVILICVNAFGRYILQAPVIWAEEVLGYTLVWIVYLGAVEVTRDGGHLSMDLITQSLSARWRRPVEFIRNLVFLAVCALIVYQSIGSISEFTYRSQVANIPVNLLHLVIPISFTAMFLLIAMRCFRIVTMVDEDAAPTEATGAPRQ